LDYTTTVKTKEKENPSKGDVVVVKVNKKEAIPSQLIAIHQLTVIQFE
jgi:hypothetical protein